MDGSDDLLQSDQSSTELTPDEIEILSLLPDSLEQYLFNQESPPTLDLFELDVNPNMNLFNPLLSLDTDPVVQHGGVLNNPPAACTEADPDNTDHPAGNDTPQPSVSGNVDPTTQTRLSRTDVDRLIREGGDVNGYHALPQPRFNSVTLRRTTNMREINSTDLASYHARLHNMLTGIVNFAREFDTNSPVINITLMAPSLQMPVSGILTHSNNYNVIGFMDQIEKVLQSNDRLLSDQTVEFEASLAMNRQGGGRRRKLTDLAVDEVIKRKKTSLFCPINISNNLCFSICLARFLNPQHPESDLEKLTTVIQNSVGFSIQDPIGLCDIASFERALDIKIVIFHRCLNAFLGSTYVCPFCYKSYTNPRHHRCKHACNICFDAECYRFQARIIHCPDCLRYCKSAYCFEMH
ncbi:uncharacterized protein LOC113114924 [Carassius auratus]|uniref:Uncharacterized protein LOC113114924 n=1 Tax=Carassius auratus TaxID=7957 RepID=A0A6P6QX31_CARAU|nr:uncharacterized protein LOC113114924 [Carassius auratus]